MARLSKTLTASAPPSVCNDLHAILDALPVGVIIADKDGHIVHTSRLAADLPADVAQAVEQTLTQTLANGHAAAKTAAFTMGGRQKSLHLGATALYDSHSRIAGAVATISDPAGQRQADWEAWQRNRQLEALLLQAPIGIAFIDENLRYLALTRTPDPIGEPRQIISGASVEDMVRPHHPPDVAREVLNIHQAVLETGIPAKGSGWKFTRPDGSSYYADWELRRVSIGPKILGLVGTAVDVTTYIETSNELEKLKNNLENTIRERTAELARANETVATILESIADGFFATDDTWHVIYFNNVAARLTGADGSQVVGRCLWDLFPAGPSFQAPLRRVMADRRPETFETREACGDKWLEVSAYPSTDGGLVVSFRDITMRKTTEQELLRLCSLDLVGQMAAGISHEVRNPLTTVKGFLQLLARKQAYADDKSVIELIISEIDRATGIISQFLSVAKATPGETVPTDLNITIANLSPLLENTCLEHGKNLAVSTDQAIPLLYINEKEIRQLLLNLVNNAIDAMHSRGRSVTIGTIQLFHDETVLFVKDEGTGIPAEIVDKIGTPFLTTKAQGTGLGLATCYAIARRNNATIDFTTSTCGTTFFVRFHERL